MDAKLTLKLDADIINQAKNYATQHGMSLSAMVEEYFKQITSRKRKKYLAEDLAGCLKDMKHLSDKEIKDMYLKDRYNV